MRTRTMISSLPSDLVMEILSLVPMNYLRELRLTCKQWKDLSKTKSFRKMHVGKALTTSNERESQMITVIGYNLYLTSIYVGNGEPSFKHKGKLNEQVKVLRVYHCEGLLLCILKNDPRFLVWNPYLMEKRWIQPRYSHTRKGCNRFTYALGYEDKEDKSSRNCCVKLLRFIDYYDRVAPKCRFFWYEMYDFESGLWITLDVTTPYWRIELGNLGVSLKGNTYWLASERNLDNDEDDCIICFDFTKERFGKLLPLPFIDGLEHYVVLSCIREEKLAVLVDHCLSNPYELWITIKIEAEKVSWSKFLTLDRGTELMSRDGFFIDEEKKIAMGFNGFYKFNIIGDAGYFEQLKLLGEPGDHNYCWPDMCTYVPSLLQIEQPAGGGRRKQQSKLEKRRFNENMSRLVQVEADHHHQSSRRFVTATADEYWVRLFPAAENQ